ncbi:MAG: Asp-tRNA(Asn)/Glu-tRNA(Gln) amidotransferase subunit GatC [Candidatus Gribaldobacteria bacterium]|nr:Asp-tRNA(Asn)/Glu-tRNA(Gln) amidotransferase subunit GatC [Candidatus Gribaldobacteria bacterium]
MIDKKLVENVARLARLELSDNEKTKIQRDLSAILDYVTLLNEVEVSDVKPFYENTALFNVTRIDDIAIDSELTAQKIIEQFPREDNSYLKVKAIL